MKRTFIAIKIPLSRHAIELFGNIKLKLKDEKIKWVDIWNMHLTLFFLGDTEESLIPLISKELSNSLSGVKSFELQISGIGIFKNLNDPRVIWYGLNQNNNLIKIKHKVNEALNEFGFETDNKKFRPHLTLGRIKHLKNTEALHELAGRYKECTIQDVLVNEVIIYESKLTPTGPIYSILKKIKLD